MSILAANRSFPETLDDGHAPTHVAETHSPPSRPAALVAFGRRAAALPGVPALMMDAAALVAEILGVDDYGIAELSDDRGHLDLCLSATRDALLAGETVAQRQAPFDSRTSLAAFTLQAACAMVVADLPADRRFNDSFLIDQGFRSALMAPLQMSDEAYGAIGVFSREPREFLIEDMLFAEAIAQLVSSTIGRERAVKQLAEERRLTSALFASIDALMLVFDSVGRIRKVNTAFERLTGFTLQEVVGRPVWNTLLVHDDVAETQAMFERLRTTREPIEHENSILTKHGERRRVRWSNSVTLDAAGEIDSIVAAGIDVTRERQVEEKYRALEAAIECERALQNPAAIATTAGSPTDDKPPAPFRPLDPGGFAERRKRPRRSFQYQQRVAPFIDGQTPPADSFREVQCHDISSGGFSFVVDQLPNHVRYIVALGMPPIQMHVVAKVIHSKTVTENGKTHHIIGCQYVSRADCVERQEPRTK